MVVLGAGGFIGRALSARLAARGVLARTVTRANTGTLDANTDWPRLLDGAHTVIHLASPTGITSRNRGEVDAAIGMAETLNRAARGCGLTRIILMSSIKAMSGRGNTVALRADMPPQPQDEYGRMKLAIEIALGGAPGLTILRPPLVYGPDVKGNFRLLLDAAARGWPLPFASVSNQRAFIFIDNLLDIIEKLLSPEAPGGVFLMRDAEISTPDLLRSMAKQMGRPSRLVAFPPSIMRSAMVLAGSGNTADALFGSLVIDDSATRAQLGWQPRVSVDEGLAATCRWFQGTAE